MHVPVLALAALLTLTTTLSAAQRPNVLFLIADDLSAEALGCYGNDTCKTPHVDGLAQKGVRFTRAYCQFPVCGPSRAALMSGMYCQSIGVTGNGSATRFSKNLGERPSMAGHFKRNGYFTARVSKIYHMRVPGDITAGIDGPDHAPSWTERYNCKAPEWFSEGEAEHLTNEKLRFDRDKHYGLGFGTAFYVVKGSTDGAEQADHQAATKAIELLEAHRNEPFFLAVGLVRPHVPLVAPKSYFEPYPPSRITLPEQRSGDWDDIPRAGISRNSRGSGLDSAAKKQRVLSAYYASVAYMDAQVGRILAALDRLKLRENTLVVFTSDHGYHLGEHEFWQKMSLHEESTRIPLIVAAPGAMAGVSGSLAQQIDIYPTLADVAGLPIPEHVQGRSLKPILADPNRDVHEQVYCLKSGGHLLRTLDWALISYGQKRGVELYDMRRDPKQFRNLAKDPEFAKPLAEMRGRLQRQLALIGAKP